MRSISCSRVCAASLGVLVAPALLSCGGGGDGPSGPPAATPAIQVTASITPATANPGDSVHLSIVATPSAGAEVQWIAYSVAGVVALSDSVAVSGSPAVIQRNLVLPTTPSSGVIDVSVRAGGTGAQGSAHAQASMGNPGGPTLLSMTLTPPDSLEPSDTLSVSFTASMTQVVIARTSLTFSQAFLDTTFNDAGVSSAARTWRGRVPTSAPLGPLLVTARVEDVNAAKNSITRAVKLVDHHAPVIATSSVQNRYAPRTDSTYFRFMVGDTVDYYITASDNGEVRWAGIAIGAPASVRDSIALSSPFVAAHGTYVLAPSAVGRNQFMLFARDEAGNIATSFGNGSASLITMPVFPVLARSFQKQPWAEFVRDVIFDEKRNVAYVLGDSARIITVSLSTGAVVSRIPLPGVAADFDAYPSGDTIVAVIPSLSELAFVSLIGTPQVVDTAFLDFAAAGVDAPARVGVAANGTVFAVPSGPRPYLIMQYDPATRSRRSRGSQGIIASYYPTIATSASHDRVAFYSDESAFLYNSASDSFSPRKGVLTNGYEFSASNDLQRVAAGAAILDATLTRLYDAGIPRSNYRGAIAGDGTVVYYPTTYGYVTMRVSDGNIIDATSVVNPHALPVFGPQRIFASPSGSRVLLFSYGAYYLIDPH